jgi:hypothetical protein
MSYRIDVSKIDAPVIDEQGFLSAYAKFTRCGVFPYLKWDGTIEWELRHPDDVLLQESIDTMKSIVVTNDHPPMMLSPDNAKDYAAGFTGETVDVIDSKYLGGKIKLIDEKAISDVTQGGKEQISMGYFCQMIDEVGTYDGIAYTKRQKNIKYNHASIVWEGRAGPEVKIKTDSVEDFAVMKTDAQKNTCANIVLQVQSNNKSENAKMKHTIKLDNVEIEVSGEFQKSFDSMIDSHKKQITELTAKNDSLVVQLSKRDEEVKQLKDSFSDEKILERADSLIKIKEFAKKVLGEDKKDTIENLKKLVVQKLTGFDVSKLDSVYIDSSFHTLMATQKDNTKIDPIKEDLKEVVTQDSAEDLQKKHYDELSNRWKKK